MRKVDAGEFYVAPAENHFTEYKPFRAERYLPPETAQPPAEVSVIPESSAEQQASAHRAGEAGNVDVRRLREQYEQAAQPSDTGTVTGTPVPAAAPSAQGAAASGSASAASSVASAVGATSASAVIVAIVIIAVSLFPIIGRFIAFAAGADYFSLTVDMDAVLACDTSFRGLSASDFYLEVETGDGIKTIPMLDGKRTYLLTGLQPNSSYTYKLLCSNAGFGSSSACYTDTVTTASPGRATGICDENRTFVTRDEASRTATLHYAVYVSDAAHEFDQYTFYICASGQTDDILPDDVLYTVSGTDADGFFAGRLDGITRDRVYLYAVGTKEETAPVLDRRAETIVFSKEIEIGLPGEWLVPDEPAPPLFGVDEGSQTCEYLSDLITLRGGLTALDDTRVFGATVTQYDADGGVLAENEEANLETDAEGLRYELQCAAYYGVRTYRYTVFAYGEAGDTETVYESGLLDFTASQDFIAVYERVTPADAAIGYTDDAVTITVPVRFASDPRNDYFILYLTDGEGNVLDSRTSNDATDSALVFTLARADLPDAVNFRYADCGSFINRETVVYEEHECDSVTIGYPGVTLGEQFGFDGEHFTIPVLIDTVYDLTGATLELEVTNGDATYVQRAGDLIAGDNEIALTAVPGEPGNVHVTARLTFRDNQSDGAEHTLTLAERDYEMNYLFSVSDVRADISGETDTTIPVTLSFEALRVPGSCQIRITEVGGTTDVTIPVTEKEYSFSTTPVGTVGQITVTLTDADGNAVGTPVTYTIDAAAAREAYTDRSTYSAVNPFSSAVTYNEDGTINVYRRIQFSSTDPNLFCNARIFGYQESEDGSVNRVITIDCITRGTYAVLENIPLLSYSFSYCLGVSYNGVQYTVEVDQTPSGTILQDGITATVTSSESADGTTLLVTPDRFLYSNGRIVVNGKEYTLDQQNELTLSAGTEIPNEVTVYIAMFPENYDEYIQNGDIEMRGDQYFALTVTVTAEETTDG